MAGKSENKKRMKQARAEIEREPESIASKPLASGKAPKKEKRIRGTFSIPEGDYALIAGLKAKLKARKLPTKKNQLLRAGLRALADMAPVDLHEAIVALGVTRKLSRQRRS